MENLYQPESFPGAHLPGTLWRRKGTITLVFGLIVAAGLAWLSVAPRTFLSEAKLYVRLGREAVTLDPTATATGQVVSFNDSRESEINAIQELLSSRQLLEQVVESLGESAVLEEKPESEAQGSGGGVGLGELLAPLDRVNLNPLKVYSLRDEAIEHLGKNLGVQTGKKTWVISVSYESEDPRLAQQILETLIQHAREEHLRVNRTKGSQQFFDDQAQLLHSRLSGLEAELRDLKNDSGLAAPDQQRQIHVERLGKLEDDLVAAQTELRAAEAEVKARRAVLATLPEMVVVERVSGQPNTPEFAMREKLYELELEEQRLAARLKDDAPQLVTLRTQVAEARRILGEEQEKVQVRQGLSQERQTMVLALQERETAMLAAKARVASLETQLADARTKIETINNNELKIAQLQRAIELATENYRKYADNLEQARIDAELDAAKISSINVLQPPSLSATPASPKLTMMMGLTGLVAMVASVGLAVLLDRRPAAASASAVAAGPTTASSPSAPPAPRAPAERVVERAAERPPPVLPEPVAELVRHGEHVPAQPR